jgi:enoyl-CoA hydratase/carnithine racemase
MEDLDVSFGSDGVLRLQLNRPAVRNAFTMDMIDEMRDAVDSANREDSIGSILLTGAGKNFCAGAQVGGKGLARPSPMASKQHVADHVHRLALVLDNCDKPSVAAVQGAAVAGGMDLALMCDIRYAAKTARFAATYVKLGLVPGLGGCYFLSRLIGMSRAMEMLLTGDEIDGVTAAQVGLVSKVFEEDAVVAEADALARRLAAGPRLSVRSIKRAVKQSQQIDLRTHLEMMSSLVALIGTTDDAAEGVKAFMEKRRPEFRGR